jgi:GH15 family glucan-1,4-alpha-glucosidase
LIRLEDGGARTFGADPLTIRSAVPLTVEDGTMRASFSVGEGDTAGFAMRWSPGTQRHRPPTTEAGDVAARIEDTAEAWRSWEAEHDVYDGPHRDLVRHSARVLKGLTYRPTGAIVAAPTAVAPRDRRRRAQLGLPLLLDSRLEPDARGALHRRVHRRAEEFVSFMTSSAGGRADERSLQIMYGIGGEHDLSERQLDHLRGWRDSRPVRVGNGAWNQTQLDVYGELLNALYVYRERLGELHPEIQAFVADLADTAARRWLEKDSGIWEMRGEPLHHLSSKVLCWTALDRAVKLAPYLGEHAKEAEWAAERDSIREAIVEQGWSEPKQAYAQSFGAHALDGAQLLMPIYGFLPATDPRMRSTIDAIASELTEDGLVLRYRAEEGLNADGLTGEEGTFVICSFWLVSCLAQAGEVERREALFAQLAGYANDLGLLGEEIDTANGEQLGNFPQAYSHIGLITAAYEIDKARGATG